MVEGSNSVRYIGNFNQQSKKTVSPKSKFPYFVLVTDEKNVLCVRVLRHVTNE